jgi:hypothetical protein
MTKHKKSNKNVSVVNSDPNMLSLLEVARECELSDVYVRHAIRNKLLPTTMVPVRPDSKTMKHMISREDMLAWRETRKARSRRADGRNKFVLYARADELAQIQELLASNGIDTPIEKAYAKKEDDIEPIEA